MIAQLVAGVLGAALMQGAAAQAEPVFSPEATERCVAEAYNASPSRSGHAVLDCVGRSAQACISSAGGDTTIGMMACFDGELRYWDRRLNEAYSRKRQSARQSDQELAGIRATALSSSDTLRTMQLAWIAFRDAACLHEQAQWMGGTGAGPATLDCHMHETARQALKLEGWWAQ